MAVDAVYTHTQHLGVGFLEGAPCRLEGGQLPGSATSEVKHVEGQQYVALTSMLAQSNFVADGRW